MKRIYIILLAAITSLSACKKDEDNVSKIVDVSYPEITLKGTDVVHLAVGATYTDAGATLKDDITGQTSDLTAPADAVNTAEVGLYVVNFSASNANGYETSLSRVVTVTNVNDPIDYSGEYVRSANGQICTIEKVSNGVYKLTNPGGAVGADDVIIYMVETTPGTFIAPSQPSSVGTFGLSGIEFSNNAFSWVAVNAGYGTAVRTFVKQ
jgi:hypothetical protein